MIRVETPGEVLRRQLVLHGLSATSLARAIHVPVNRVTLILQGKRTVTADTALRLERFLPWTTAEFWMGLQSAYDLEFNQRKHAAALKKIKPVNR